MLSLMIDNLPANVQKNRNIGKYLNAIQITAHIITKENTLLSAKQTGRFIQPARRPPSSATCPVIARYEAIQCTRMDCFTLRVRNDG
jgi:hypothetical protein